MSGTVGKVEKLIVEQGECCQSSCRVFLNEVAGERKGTEVQFTLWQDEAPTPMHSAWVSMLSSAFIEDRFIAVFHDVDSPMVTGVGLMDSAELPG